MSITVAEKTHWKERIAQKIERAIKELVATSDPHYLERISDEARVRAIESLGGTQLVKELKTLEAKEAALQTEIERIQGELAAIAKKIGARPKTHYYGSQENSVLWSAAIELRKEAEERELLLKDPLGQRILKLRGEQESLLDTVWLSTSNVQIRELWKNVTELTAGELSDLQKQILARPANPEGDK